MKRGDDATQDAQRHDEGEGDGAQQGGIGQRRAHERGDRDPEREGHAHIAGHEMADPVPVLDEERPVDAELMVQVRHRPGIGERPEDRAAHITRQELAAGKHDHAEQPERDQREHQAFRQNPD